MAEDKNVNDDVWTDRINAFWNGLLKVLQVLGPVLTAFVLYMQSQTHSKIAEAKAEIKSVAVDAATNAQTAATDAQSAAKETANVKAQLTASMEERRDEFKSITEKQDETHKAITKVIEPMARSREAKEPKEAPPPVVP